MTNLVLGVISDTHGLLRPEALAALAGVDRILHAGDVGGGDVLEQLAEIAQVTAIRGNVDRAGPTSELPEQRRLTLAGYRVFMLHDVNTLDCDPAGSCDLVVAGHSHRPRSELVAGVHYFNPGSAGPRRFSLPITVGRLRLSSSGINARIVPLPIP